MLRSHRVATYEGELAVPALSEDWHELGEQVVASHVDSRRCGETQHDVRLVVPR
jgi:hypothetical protein